MRKTKIIPHFKPFIIGFLLVTVTSFHCKITSNSKKTTDNKNDTIIGLKELARKSYGSEYTIVYNETKTYAVCRKGKKKQPQIPNSYCNFFIYDILNNSVSSKNKILQASIQWENDTLIRVTKFTHGHKKELPDNNKLIYYYNVLSNEKIKSYKKK